MSETKEAAAILGKAGGLAGRGDKKARRREIMQNAIRIRWAKFKPKPLEERFWNSVKKGAKDSCWLWEGAINPYGYGEVYTGKKFERAHRVSYTLFVGPIKEGLIICHKCDVRHCVNPNHLFAGTHKDNTQDAIKKGRFVFRRRGSKYTPELMHSLRKDYETMTAKEVARKHNLPYKIVFCLLCDNHYKKLYIAR